MDAGQASGQVNRATVDNSRSKEETEAPLYDEMPLLPLQMSMVLCVAACAYTQLNSLIDVNLG